MRLDSRQRAIVTAMALLIGFGQSGRGQPQVSTLQMVSKNRGVLLRGKDLLVLETAKASAWLWRRVDYVAVDRTRYLMLTAKRSKGQCELVLTKIKSTPRPVATAKVLVDVQDLVYANYPPFDAFCVIWLVGGPGNNASVVWQSSLVLHAQEIGDALFINTVPLLSGLSGLVRPGSLLFSRYMPYTFAAAVLVDPGAAPVFAQQFPDAERHGYEYFLVVSGPRIIVAVPITGLASSRPIAFSEDGKRLMARLSLQSRKQETPVVILDLESGRARPCRYVPAGSRILAASGDLESAVVLEKGSILLVSRDKDAVRLTQLPPNVAAVADYVEGMFFITDGQQLWQVSPSGTVNKKKLQQLKK